MECIKRHWSGRLQKPIAVIFAIVFVVSFFSTFSASAKSSLFKIQSTAISELSATAEGTVTSSDNTNITSDIALKRLGDYAKYTITLKNTDNKDHTIESITNNNTNIYVSYTHNSYTNTLVKAGATFDFVVTAKYVNMITDPSSSAQTAEVQFTLKFSDIGPEIITINPGTEDNITTNVIALAIFTTSFIVVRYISKKNRKASKLLVAGIISFSAFASASIVKATSVTVENFTTKTNFTLKAGRLIHYNGNYPDGGEMEDDHLTTTGRLRPNTYTAIGYHFAGWSLEMDGEKVYDDEEPMSNIPDGDDPLTLYVIWEPNKFTFVFHANSNLATGSMEPFKAEYEGTRMRLPYNEFELDGYRFTGWKIGNENKFLNDRANVAYFDAENGAIINLYAQWELVPVGIDYYKNSPEASGTTTRQENPDRITSLRTPNFRHDGYGFAGWNTEADGTGTLYGPNERVIIPSAGLKLYATWIKAEESVTMQTFDDTTEPYASYPTGKVIALKDNRDNQAYTVAKLPDGKWWMTENLRLNPAGIQLTAENTNNPTQAVRNITSSENLCAENTATCINRFTYSISNLNPSTSGNFAYGNGGYYNIYAATAGHAAVDINNPVTELVSGDICPKGWHLPVSGTNGDFRTLDIALGGDGYNTVDSYEHAQKYFKAPINFIVAGWGIGEVGAYRNIGNEAAYLENGTDGLKHNASFFDDASTTITNGVTEKYNTHTIRCIAD